MLKGTAATTREEGGEGGVEFWSTAFRKRGGGRGRTQYGH